MRIRRQLLVSLCLSAAVSLVALGGFVTYLHTEDGLRLSQEHAQAAAHAAADLLVLTQEFAYTGEARAAQQWHSRAAAISAAIDADGEQTPDHGRIRQRLQSDLADVVSIFGDFEHRAPRADGSRPNDTTTDADRIGTIAADARRRAELVAASRKQILVDSLLTQTQAVSGGAYRWAAELGEQRKQVSRRRLWVFAGISLAFSLVILHLAYVVLRRVLQPLARLEEAAAAIRAGRAVVRIDSSAKDELGNLTRQFDGMTTALTDHNTRLIQTAAALASEAALRSEAEKRIRLITDNLPVLVAYVDIDSRYRFANRQYEFMLGLDSNSMVGRRVSDVLGKTNFERIQAHADEALRGRTTVFEVRIETEYATRDLWASYVPDFDPQGAVQGFFVMHEDITVQKQSAAELKTLYDRYALATRSGGVGVWDWNAATGELNCDRQMHALYQMPAETGRMAPLREWAARIHPDDAMRAEQDFRDAMQGVRLYDTEFRLLLPDGVQRVVKASGTVKRDAAGRPLSMVGLNWDISALRNAESEQRKTEERFRLLVDGVADYAIVMLDPDGKVEGWNGAAQHMKGYAAQEVLGRHFSMFYTASDQLRQHPAALLSQAVAQGRTDEHGWRVRKDGTLFWADVTITALRNASGSLRGFGKVIRDMTAQKQKEDAIAQALQEKDALIAVLSGQAIGVRAVAPHVE